MNLEEARVIWKFRRPHELEILNYHEVRGGERHGKTVIALKGPPWSLPHALSRILVEGTEEERQFVAERSASVMKVAGDGKSRRTLAPSVPDFMGACTQGIIALSKTRAI